MRSSANTPSSLSSSRCSRLFAGRCAGGGARAGGRAVVVWAADPPPACAAGRRSEAQGVRRWFVFGFEGVCVPFVHVRVFAIAALGPCLDAAGVDESPTCDCDPYACLRLPRGGLAHEKSRLLAGFDVWGSSGRASCPPLCGLLCASPAHSAGLLHRAFAGVRPAAFDDLKPSKPASEGGFSCALPCFESQMPRWSFLLPLVNSEQAPPPRARVEAGASGDMPCRRLHAAHRCFCR